MGSIVDHVVSVVLILLVYLAYCHVCIASEINPQMMKRPLQ